MQAETSEQTIILGGGCFWCVESVFQQLKGVTSVISGYAGGEEATANYRAVCQGDSGHIEVVKITFNPSIITLPNLLDIFFATHDPTTQDRQGNDVGRQYASVIFYTDASQQAVITQRIDHLKTNGIAVVTEVYPAPIFYRAETYHQNYYANHPLQGYCNLVIPPKLAKLRENFARYLN